MSDAAEVLGAIYDSLRAVQGGGELVDSVFGLHVSERVHCGACGKDTHASAYTQFFYNASATALRLQVSCIARARWRPNMVPTACMMHWHSLFFAASLLMSMNTRVFACCLEVKGLPQCWHTLCMRHASLAQCAYLLLCCASLCNQAT